MIETMDATADATLRKRVIRALLRTPHHPESIHMASGALDQLRHECDGQDLKLSAVGSPPALVTAFMGLLIVPIKFGSPTRVEVHHRRSGLPQVLVVQE